MFATSLCDAFRRRLAEFGVARRQMSTCLLLEDALKRLLQLPVGHQLVARVQEGPRQQQRRRRPTLQRLAGAQQLLQWLELQVRRCGEGPRRHNYRRWPSTCETKKGTDSLNPD